MMHPIWFAMWCWDRFWDPRELIPAFEANQGTLSLLALVVALVAFGVENHRANKAQLAAAKAENDRKLEAYEARTAQEAAIAQAKIDQHFARISEFASIVRGALLEVQAELVLEQGNTPSYDVVIPVLDRGTLRTAQACHDLIQATLPAAPHEAALIKVAMNALRSIAAVISQTGNLNAPAARKVIEGLKADIIAAVFLVQDAQAEIAHRLYGQPSPISGDIAPEDTRML
jgi:hypothetical protein